MMKNIGWTKKRAEDMAKRCKTSEVDAYAQKEEYFNRYFNRHFGVESNYQWIVVLQKRPK